MTHFTETTAAQVDDLVRFHLTQANPFPMTASGAATTDYFHY